MDAPMKRWSQAAAILAAVGMVTSSHAQPPQSGETAPREGEKSPSASARWQPQWKVTIPDSRRAYEAHGSTSTQNGEPTPLADAPGAAGGEWGAPHFEKSRQRAERRVLGERLEFESQFAPTRRYDNPIQQTVSQWFYRTNDLIYTWYGGFHSWQREFDETMSQILFGRQPPVPQDESFFGQPRFQTKVDPSGATIRIDVPFGR